MSALLERQKEFAGYLVAGFPELGLTGLPLKSASAGSGNATVENKVLPVTIGTKDHGSDGALQWRLDRLEGPSGLKGWAAIHNLPWDTLRTQAAFFLWELGSDPRYARLERDLREGKKKIETLTANICVIYERPAPESAGLDKRIEAAKATYAAMATDPVGPSVAGGGLIVATANQAIGGSSVNSIIILVIVAAAILFIEYVKRRQSDAAQEPSDHPQDSPSKTPLGTMTDSLELAMANVRTCKAAYEKALRTAIDERQRVQAKIQAMQVADQTAERELPVADAGAKLEG